MAKQKANTATKKSSGRPSEGLTYRQISDLMLVETATILTDYVRQYVGIATQTPTPGSGVFINPDRVLRSQTFQETAWYDLYAEVMKDPHISAIAQTRSLAVSGQKWQVFPFDESNSRYRKHAEFAQSCLEYLENFNQDINELMSGVFFGFAVSEIVWDDESVNGAVVPKQIMNRPQRRFQFDASTREPKLRTQDNAYWGDPLPARKFIVHRSSTLWENPFGDALLQKLYWMWLFKKTVLGFWMKKNEVDMSCVPLVKVPNGASQELKNEAMSIAQNMRVGAYGYIPDNFEMIWAQASAATGAEQYSLFVNLCDDQMTKAVLGQTLTTEGSAGGSGSRALGTVHNDVRSDIREFDSRAIEGTLNSTLIRWIIDLNFGVQDYYPRFRFVNEEMQDVKADSEVVKNLVAAGFKPTREWVAERFKVDLQEEVEATPEQVTPDPKANEVNTEDEGDK